MWGGVGNVDKYKFINLELILINYDDHQNEQSVKAFEIIISLGSPDSDG